MYRCVMERASCPWGRLTAVVEDGETRRGRGVYWREGEGQQDEQRALRGGGGRGREMRRGREGDISSPQLLFRSYDNPLRHPLPHGHRHALLPVIVFNIPVGRSALVMIKRTFFPDPSTPLMMVPRRPTLAHVIVGSL